MYFMNMRTCTSAQCVHLVIVLLNALLFSLTNAQQSASFLFPAQIQYFNYNDVVIVSYTSNCPEPYIQNWIGSTFAVVSDVLPQNGEYLYDFSKTGNGGGGGGEFIIHNKTDWPNGYLAVVSYVATSTAGAPTTWASGTSYVGNAVGSVADLPALQMTSGFYPPSADFKATVQVANPPASVAPSTTPNLTPSIAPTVAPSIAPSTTPSVSAPAKTALSSPSAGSASVASNSPSLISASTLASNNKVSGTASPSSGLTTTHFTTIHSAGTLFTIPVEVSSTSSLAFSTVASTTLPISGVLVGTVTQTAVATLSGSPLAASSSSPGIGEDIGIGAAVFLALLFLVIAASAVLYKRRRNQTLLKNTARFDDEIGFPSKPELDGLNKINEVDAQDQRFRGGELDAGQTFSNELPAGHIYHGHELPATPLFRSFSELPATPLSGRRPRKNIPPALVLTVRTGK